MCSTNCLLGSSYGSHSRTAMTRFASQKSGMPFAVASVFSSLHSTGSPVWSNAHVRTIQRGDRSESQEPQRALEVGELDFQNSRPAGLARNGQSISVCSPA